MPAVENVDELPPPGDLRNLSTAWRELTELMALVRKAGYQVMIDNRLVGPESTMQVTEPEPPPPPTPPPRKRYIFQGMGENAAEPILKATKRHNPFAPEPESESPFTGFLESPAASLLMGFLDDDDEEEEEEEYEDDDDEEDDDGV